MFVLTRCMRTRAFSLNGVRPSWPEQSPSSPGLGHVAAEGLNGVRPSWPEQSLHDANGNGVPGVVSMESGLVGRNNAPFPSEKSSRTDVSMESGLVGRNNMKDPELVTEAYKSQWSPA